MKKIFIFLAAAFCLASAIGQEKAESMLSRVVKEVDTTEKSNGMSY